MGVLAVSRAIGDHCLRPFVIAQPEVPILLPQYPHNAESAAACSLRQLAISHQLHWNICIISQVLYSQPLAMGRADC